MHIPTSALHPFYDIVKIILDMLPKYLRANHSNLKLHSYVIIVYFGVGHIF